MISIVAFSLSAILAVIAAILFFKLNVRGLMDDLSGKKAERQIREIREQNMQPVGNKNGRILQDTPVEKTPSKLLFGKKAEKTARLAAENTARLSRDEESTTLLQDGRESTALLQNAGESTTLLQEKDEGTTLLNNDDGTALLAEEGTTLLEGPAAKLQHSNQLLVDVMVIHTEERI